MSEFYDALNAGMAGMMAQARVRFTKNGRDNYGIFGDSSESNGLIDGGFEQDLAAQIIIPFSEEISEPKHDEKITIHFTSPTPKSVIYKIGQPIQRDEVSWILNLISAV